VMLMEKAGTATFYVKDGQTGREGIVNNADFLNSHQEKQMATQPDLILQFAHFLGTHYASQGVAAPSVRAEVYVTLNGRPSKLLVDPTCNLMQEKDGWAPKPWVTAYHK
jgi:Vitamin K-dependent gamma-carboxylase